jgi:hypothetical protein
MADAHVTSRRIAALAPTVAALAPTVAALAPTVAALAPTVAAYGCSLGCQGWRPDGGGALFWPNPKPLRTSPHPLRWPARSPSYMRSRPTPSSCRNPAGAPQPCTSTRTLADPSPHPNPYPSPSPKPSPSPNLNPSPIPYPNPALTHLSLSLRLSLRLSLSPSSSPSTSRSNTFLTGRERHGERPSTAGPTHASAAGREREIREQPVRLPVAAKEGAAGRMLPGKDGRLYKAGRGA